MFWLTGALFLLSIVSAGVALWQGKIARDQLDFARKSSVDASRDTRDALKLTSRVAGAAEKQAIAFENVATSAITSAGLARQSLRAQQTAPVAFFIAGEPIIVLNRKLRVDFSVRPSGSLPISDVSIATQLAMSPPDPDFAVRSILKPMPWSFSQLNPGVSSGSTIESDRPLSEADMQALASGQMRIYAHGEIRYSDANGRHVVHTCAEFFGEGGKRSNACRTRRDR